MNGPNKKKNNKKKVKKKQTNLKEKPIGIVYF